MIYWLPNSQPMPPQRSREAIYLLAATVILAIEVAWVWMVLS